MIPTNTPLKPCPDVIPTGRMNLNDCHHRGNILCWFKLALFGWNGWQWILSIFGGWRTLPHIPLGSSVFLVRGQQSHKLVVGFQYWVCTVIKFPNFCLVLFHLCTMHDQLGTGSWNIWPLGWKTSQHRQAFWLRGWGWGCQFPSFPIAIHFCWQYLDLLFHADIQITADFSMETWWFQYPNPIFDMSIFCL